MKKTFIPALILLLFLAACGQPVAAPAPSPIPEKSKAPEQPEAPALENAWGSALIIDVRDGGLVVLLDDPSGPAVMPMPGEIGFASEELGTELLPGMTVQLAGGGDSVRMSWPAQADADRLLAVGYDGGLISLYRQVLEELEARCPELDEGTSRLCIDLHSAFNLPAGAGSVMAWCANSWFDREVMRDTMGGLSDKGYLGAGPDLRWEDGVFIGLCTEDVTEDSFTLLCTKQRSREEKLSLTIEARKTDGLWSWQEVTP